MQKLFKKIVYFLFPLLLLVIILPIDKRLKYQGLSDDCEGRGIWIHDRLYVNPEPIDIAFLGTSHTMNGIEDQLIDSIVNGHRVVNLGYCRTGRNLTHALIDALLSEKKVKYLILEVRDYEARYGHPVFPHLAETKQVMLSTPFLNKNFFSDIWTHLVYKIEIWQDQLYLEERIKPFSYKNFGFYTSDHIADPKFLEQVHIQKKGHKDSGISMVEMIYGNFSKSYLERIAKLCRKNNVKIVFLYIPAFGSNREVPQANRVYRQYGDVWFPPKHIFDDKANWQDKGHLNRIGAKDLSLWLAERINMKLLH